MRNFFRLATGINVCTLHQEIIRHPELWNQNTFRTTYKNTPFAEADDIWLRFSDPAKCETNQDAIGDQYSIWHPPVLKLPSAKQIVLDLMRAVDAYELGRVIVSRLKPGGHMLPHTDKNGSYVDMRDGVRYHVVIQGFPGSLFRNGDETVCMMTGEVWQFNHAIEHEIINNSVDDRIHLLVDLRIWPTSW